uniref:Uncharacterized protein n=1 Tax=Arundo donax TaxID=35708 RepID=A0A0A9HIG0_ARUDO
MILKKIHIKKNPLDIIFSVPCEKYIMCKNEDKYTVWQRKHLQKINSAHEKYLKRKQKML